MKLILFDVDGTLLLTDGAGRRAVHRALLDEYGVTGPVDHRFDGKTDPQIVRELMRLAGHDDGRIDAGMQRVFARYVGYLTEELRDRDYRPHVLPGVPALLQALARDDRAIVGLLTGNLAEGADAKLRAVGVEPSQFVVGAFGSDHERRPQLAAIALARAREMLHTDIAGSDTVVVGDTPADIACGQSIGASTIGVATGQFGVSELLASGADVAFADCSDTQAVLNAMFRHNATNA